MKSLITALLALLMTGCALIQKKPQGLVAIPGYPASPVTPALFARDLVPASAPPMVVPGRPTFARTLARPMVRLLALEGASLSIYYTNLVDMCMVTWVTTPPTTNGIIASPGGTGTINIAQYTGPAVALVGNNIGGDNVGLFIEISHDLTNPSNWVAWPQPGFQLTLIATNNTSCFPIDFTNAATFFRGHLGLINQ